MMVSTRKTAIKGESPKPSSSRGVMLRSSPRNVTKNNTKTSVLGTRKSMLSDSPSRPKQARKSLSQLTAAGSSIDLNHEETVPCGEKTKKEQPQQETVNSEKCQQKLVLKHQQLPTPKPEQIQSADVDQELQSPIPQQKASDSGSIQEKRTLLNTQEQANCLQDPLPTKSVVSQNRSLRENCVFCKRSFGQCARYPVNSCLNNKTNLKDLILKYGGMTVTSGNICSPCLHNLNTLKNQCENVAEICPLSAPSKQLTDTATGKSDKQNDAPDHQVEKHNPSNSTSCPDKPLKTSSKINDSSRNLIPVLISPTLLGTLRPPRPNNTVVAVHSNVSADKTIQSQAKPDVSSSTKETHAENTQKSLKSSDNNPFPIFLRTPATLSSLQKNKSNTDANNVKSVQSETITESTLTGTRKTPSVTSESNALESNLITDNSTFNQTSPRVSSRFKTPSKKYSSFNVSPLKKGSQSKPDLLPLPNKTPTATPDKGTKRKFAIKRVNEKSVTKVANMIGKGKQMIFLVSPVKGSFGKTVHQKLTKDTDDPVKKLPITPSVEAPETPSAKVQTDSQDSSAQTDLELPEDSSNLTESISSPTSPTKIHSITTNVKSDNSLPLVNLVSVGASNKDSMPFLQKGLKPGTKVFVVTVPKNQKPIVINPPAKRIRNRRKKGPKTSKADHTYVGKSSSSDKKKAKKSKLKKDLRYFVCTVCRKIFFSTRTLQVHWVKHHNHLVIDQVYDYFEFQTGQSEPNYKCKLCAKCFNLDVSIIDHLKTAHSIKKPYSCGLCETSLEYKGSVRNHMSEHFPQVPLICTKCSSSFQSREEFMAHDCWMNHVDRKLNSGEGDVQHRSTMTSEEEDGTQYPCPCCEETFPSCKKLSDHWDETHIPKEHADGTETEQIVESSQETLTNVTTAVDDQISEENKELVEEGSFSTANAFPVLSELISGKKSGEVMSENVSQLVETGKISLPICSLCNTAVESSIALRAHWNNMHKSCFVDLLDDYIETKSGLMRCTCKTCSKSFPNQDDAKKHLLAEHGWTKPFLCVYCKKTITTKKKIRQHLRTHFPSGFFRCSKCPQTFVSQSNLLKHACWAEYIQSKAKKDGQTPKASGKATPVQALECRLCRVQMRCSKELHQHWEETHDVFIEEVASQVDTPIMPNLPKPKLTYQCKWCGQEFLDKKIYQRHLTVHGYKVSFKCLTCSEMFSTRIRARVHLRKHLATRRFSCPHCTWTFFDRRNLNNHLRVIHGGPSVKHQFICELCGKGFKERCRLKMHKVSAHGEDHFVNHSCDICGKGFVQRAQLNSHRQFHTEDRPHLCNICGGSFKTVGTLKSHMKVHDQTPNFKCSHCSKTFQNRRVYIAHIMVEHDQSCRSCDLPFFTVKDALMHKDACDGFQKVYESVFPDDQ